MTDSSETVNQSINQSINQSNKQSINQSNNHTFFRTKSLTSIIIDVQEKNK